VDRIQFDYAHCKLPDDLCSTNFELVTVIGSNLFDLDDDIKQYLQDPNMPLITAIKIGLRYYITADLILQINVFKDYLEKINPFLFLEVFGKQRKDRKIC
jgi:hypothetical protein